MATTPETPKTAPSAAPQLPSFDPMAMWQQGQQAFAKMMADSLARWQAFGDQYATIEAQVSTQAQAAVTNWAQLAKDAIAYGTQLSAEARKASVDAAKKLGVGA
jgi:hypothetical protein